MTPISLIVDDSCPFVHLYRYHLPDANGKEPLTGDGARLIDEIPASFLDAFCDVVERHHMAGKFSIVPMPAGRGDIVHGINGHGADATHSWLETARDRLGPRFDFSPEMLTHDFAVDLDSGITLDETELTWSRRQDARSLTRYITRALQMLKAAGIDATGVTSPWTFADHVESEYQQAMMAAQLAVYDRRLSWYFLHAFADRPTVRPYVARLDDVGLLVSIVANVRDHFWATLRRRRDDDAFLSGIADQYLTDSGEGGDLVSILHAGGWPTMVTHWQCLYSNGSMAGLRALDLLGERISRHLGTRVRWTTCLEAAEQTVAGLLADRRPRVTG